MKIEFELADIKREEVIEAMAGQMLTEWVREDLDPDEGGGTEEYRKRSALAESLRAAITKRIGEVADKLVREHFEATIKARIESEVDEVLAAGWSKTDGYGNAVGVRLDLKGRISEVITEKKREGYGNPEFTLAEKLVKSRVEKVFSSEFDKEIKEAKTALRTQLDAVLTGKVTEALKSAMGLK